MINFRIFLTVGQGNYDEAIRTLREVFAPAVSQMEGFRLCRVLAPYQLEVLAELGEQIPEYNLEIELVFDSESQRRAWAGSDLHSSIWPRIRALTTEISHLGLDVVFSMEAV